MALAETDPYFSSFLQCFSKHAETFHTLRSRLYIYNLRCMLCGSPNMLTITNTIKFDVNSYSNNICAISYHLMSPIEMGPLRILHNCWVYVFEGWDLVSIILEIKITNRNLAHCSLFARIESEFQSKQHNKVKYGGCVGERTPYQG